MNPPRLLITGSRNFTDQEAIESALAEFVASAGHPAPILVSGGCPQGADAIAESVWRSWGLPVDVHPADWSRGRRAGPERNARMVNRGADLCIGFVSDCTKKGCFTPGVHDSHGTSGCLRLAREAGIPVRVIRARPTLQNGPSTR